VSATAKISSFPPPRPDPSSFESNEARKGGANAYFAGIAARRRLTPRAAIRHSRLVRNLRLAVPAAATGLILTYAVSATPPEVDQEFLRQFSDIEATGSEMRLDRPRYVGEDTGGIPFEVSAFAARRNPNAPDIIRLENPEALRNGGSNDQLRVRALSGTLDTQGKTVDLNDDVQLEQGVGSDTFVLRTDAARIDIDGRTVRSETGVRGTGRAGDVEADTLTVYEDEERAVFEGNVKFRFEPAKMRDDEESALRD